MSDMPTLKVQVPQEVPAEPASVSAALRSVQELHGFVQHRRVLDLDRYYRGRQYEDRQYRWDGSLIAEGMDHIVGAVLPPTSYVPPRLRRLPAQYNVAKIVVERRTAMVFGEGRFPTVHVDGDPATEDFVRACSDAARLPLAMKEARNLGGAHGTAVLSYGWRDGLPFVEVHTRCQLWVLEWADRGSRVPRVVLKVWATREPQIDQEGRLVEVDGWAARVWSGPLYDRKTGALTRPGVELRLHWEPRSPTNVERWVVDEAGSLTECPVVWIQNIADPERDDGQGDFEGSENNIDEANLILCATSTGTAVNADPTLIIHDDPMNNPGTIAKGGTNTIWAKGGASYLQMTADGVTAGMLNFDKLKALVQEEAAVTEFDPEKMSGAAQSGEALRRLMQPMTAGCDGLRDTYGAGLQQILQGWWRLALVALATPVLVEAKGPDGAARLDDQGKPILESAAQQLRLPPKIEKEVKRAPTGETQEEATKTTERVPGRGGQMRLVWPDYIPLSTEDKAKKVGMLSQAVGGKAIARLRTVVEEARDILPIDDVDEEVEGILEDTQAAAAANAAALGERDPDGPAPEPGQRVKRLPPPADPDPT